jgi:hypothetical protein
MRRAAGAVLLVLSLQGSVSAAEAEGETTEMVGQVGGRTALLVLHASRRAEGGWQIAGDYVLLPTRARRYVEGERSPELGVTTLREGNTAVLFGRPPTATLQGTWRDGVFKGTRYGPGGQERERFQFSEEFPSMEGYSATVRCEVQEGRYGAALAYTADKGALKAFEWRSSLAPSGHRCSMKGLQPEPIKGGLSLRSGRCRVTLREVGDFVRVAAEDCAQYCGSEAYFEPMLVDRRGGCALLQEARVP